MVGLLTVLVVHSRPQIQVGAGGRIHGDVECADVHSIHVVPEGQTHRERIVQDGRAQDGDASRLDVGHLRVHVVT